MASNSFEADLVARIREGEERAWQECIDRFEGRLLAFARSRLRNKSAAEDIVQEAFVGFLTSLPNYDDRTPLDSFLFAITAHKLTDHLRREGRRPAFPMFSDADSATSPREWAGSDRVASSMARSQERRVVEEEVLANALIELIERWNQQEDWERLKCMELLFVRGWPNKNVAARLNITEQAVANHKHFVVSKLRDAGTQARMTNETLEALGLSQ